MRKNLFKVLEGDFEIEEKKVSNQPSIDKKEDSGAKKKDKKEETKQSFEISINPKAKEKSSEQKKKEKEKQKKKEAEKEKKLLEAKEKAEKREQTLKELAEKEKKEKEEKKEERKKVLEETISEEYDKLIEDIKKLSASGFLSAQQAFHLCKSIPLRIETIRNCHKKIVNYYNKHNGKKPDYLLSFELAERCFNIQKEFDK